MKMMKLTMINPAVLKRPKQEPVLPVSTDLTGSLSTKLRKVSETYIKIMARSKINLDKNQYKCSTNPQYLQYKLQAVPERNGQTNYLTISLHKPYFDSYFSSL